MKNKIVAFHVCAFVRERNSIAAIQWSGPLSTPANPVLLLFFITVAGNGTRAVSEDRKEKKLYRLNDRSSVSVARRDVNYPMKLATCDSSVCLDIAILLHYIFFFINSCTDKSIRFLLSSVMETRLEGAVILLRGTVSAGEIRMQQIVKSKNDIQPRRRERRERAKGEPERCAGRLKIKQRATRGHVSMYI